MKQRYRTANKTHQTTTFQSFKYQTHLICVILTPPPPGDQTKYVTFKTVVTLRGDQAAHNCPSEKGSDRKESSAVAQAHPRVGPAGEWRASWRLSHRLAP